MSVLRAPHYTIRVCVSCNTCAVHSTLATRLRMHDDDRLNMSQGGMEATIFLSKSHVYYAVSSVVLTPEKCDFREDEEEEEAGAEA